jgi:hypothetical protein
MFSEKDDAVASAAMRHGFITEENLQEARKIQAKALEATGLALEIREILVNNGFITDAQSRELADIVAGKKPSRPAAAGATPAKAGTGTAHRKPKRSHNAPVPKHHGRATSTHPHVGAAGPMSPGAKAAIAIGIIAGLVGVWLIMTALMRHKASTRPAPQPQPQATDAVGPVSSLGKPSIERDTASTRTEKTGAEIDDLLARANRAADELREAEEYEAEHPEDLRGAAARYEKVAAGHPGTPQAGTATINIARLNSILNPRSLSAGEIASATDAPPATDAPAEEAPPADMTDFFAKYDELLANGSFTDAALLAELDAGRATTDAKAALEEAARVASLLADRVAAVRGFIESKTGTELRVATTSGERKGTVVALDEFGFTLAIEITSGRQVLGKTQMRIGFDKLTDEQEDEFAKGWKADGSDGALARAIIGLSRTDVDLAEKKLTDASGALADHLRSRIESVRLARAETDAKTALEMIHRWAARPDMTAAQAKELLDLVASFERTHGKSTAAVKEAEAIAAAQSLARRILLAAGRVEGASEYQGHVYKLYRYPMHFASAQAFCERLGGHLATIASTGENDFVFSLAKAAEACAWIGATDGESEGDWHWVTGEKLAFTAWLPGRPDGGEKENGAAVMGMLGAAAPSWNDFGRSDMPFLICEWESHKKGRAASAASDEAFAVPAGHKKVSLYKVDFQTDTGGWQGTAAQDPETGGSVLELEDTADDEYFPRRTGHLLRGGIAATLATRVTFRYRTEGLMTMTVSQNWLAVSPRVGSNYIVTYPASSAWALVDMPISDYNPNGPGIDLTGGFKIASLGIYAGPRGKDGTCFVDNFEIYDVVPAE